LVPPSAVRTVNLTSHRDALPLFSSHRRILLLIGSLAAIASLTIVAVFVVTDGERATLQAADERSSQIQADGDDLSEAIREQSEAIDDFLLTTDAEAVTRYLGATADESAAIAALNTDDVGDPGIHDALALVETESARWRSTFAEPAIAAARSGSPSALASIADVAVHDQDDVQSATSELVAKLDAVDAGLRSQQEALNQRRAIATGIGVGIQLLAAMISLVFVRRYGKRLERDAGQSSVLNRFTEVTTFAADDEAVARSNLEAIGLLAHPDAAITHVLNRSKDRAVPEATLGAAQATVLPLHALSACPGIVRGAIYVTDDATAPLSVHCPIYPADHGTVACVPLAHGENVGAVHLYWETPRAFPLELRSGVARITEHAALAIANRRLLAALRGQADTDARTGLRNTRAFDQALEDALRERSDDETMGVLMLDLDHFKDVNDRHGHPAGDEALRVFAGVIRSCLRDGDVASRYGGEEFAVLLADVDGPGAIAVAERIRSRTESTLISLAPGVTERLTVSVGVALAPDQAADRITLLRIADEALYAAKEAGRNRVVAGFQAASPATPTEPRARRQRATG
jgi:diguanylate cyclase (GGDEF)-like protein